MKKLLSGVTSPTTGAEVRLSGSTYYPTGVLQVQTSGNTQVILEGKVSAEAPWATLANVTTSGLTAFATVPFLRARVPGPIGVGVTVNAWVHVGS